MDCRPTRIRCGRAGRRVRRPGAGHKQGGAQPAAENCNSPGAMLNWLQGARPAPERKGNGMDLVAFQYFLSVSQCLSFSEAAEQNHISQSSLSKAILRLERELNVKLFDRNHHPISLTAAGLCLQEHLGQMRPLYVQAMRELDRYRVHRNIRCYFVPRLYALKNAALAFLSANRDIELTLETGSDFTTAVREMMEGDYDMAVMHQPFDLPEGVRMSMIYDDKLYAVLPQNHPLAGREAVSLAELDGYTFVETNFSATIVQGLAAKFGFRPGGIDVHRSITGSREEVMLRIARSQNIGIFCSRDITLYNIQPLKLVTRPLKEISSLPIVLLEREGRTDTEWHQRFCAFLKKEQENYCLLYTSRCV